VAASWLRADREAQDGPYGQTVHVNLSVNARNYSSDVIGNFQSYQLSHNGDPCSYSLTILSTFGQAH
jgi:hypothetical protein